MTDGGYIPNKRTTERLAATVKRVLGPLPRVPRTERRVFDDGGGDSGFNLATAGLVAGTTSTGVTTVWTLDGDVVWTGTVMSYDSGGINDTLFNVGDDGVTVISGDQRHIVTTDDAGTIVTDLSIGTALWTSARTYSSGITKNAEGIYYTSNQGGAAGGTIIQPDGTQLTGNPATNTIGEAVRISTEGYIAQWRDNSGSGYSVYSPPSGTWAAMSMSTASFGSGGTVGDIDITTNKLYLIGNAAQLTVTLSTNVGVAAAGVGSTVTAAWIPPWGGKFHYAVGGSLFNQSLGTVPQEPTLSSVGGVINKMAGGWVLGRKYAVVASASGIRLCDAGGQVWSKSGNYKSCDFRGTSPTY